MLLPHLCQHMQHLLVPVLLFDREPALTICHSAIKTTMDMVVMPIDFIDRQTLLTDTLAFSRENTTAILSLIPSFM